MMEFTEISFPDVTPVDGYGPGFFRIRGSIVRGPILLSGTGLAPWGGVDDAASLAPLLAGVDVVLIGTGDDFQPLPASLKAAVEAADIGFEVMATPAACRTLNVLISEGRRVVLAAVPVS